MKTSAFRRHIDANGLPDIGQADKLAETINEEISENIRETITAFQQHLKFHEEINSFEGINFIGNTNGLVERIVAENGRLSKMEAMDVIVIGANVIELLAQVGVLEYRLLEPTISEASRNEITGKLKINE
jgi:hypothetical protein